MNQLNRNRHTPVLTLYRPFHNAIYPQLSCNFWKRREWFLGSLELHHRSARDDPEGADLGEITDQRFRHPIRKVLLRCIPRQILQRKHSQRFDFGLQRSLCSTMHPAISNRSYDECSKPAKNQPAAPPKGSPCPQTTLL